MKYVLAALVVVGLSFWMQRALLDPRAQEIARMPGGTRIPVLVELFTSEGCSSCPPADALLAKLEKEQPVSGAQVIAVEEHVDYWDSLGWKDPYSSFDWTMRQQQYSQAFGSGSVYTPQMVVDGRAEFIGSRERQAEKEVLEAARVAKAEVIVIRDQPTKDGTQQFTIRVGRLTGSASGDTAEVWLGVTEGQLQSAVTRGENAGENLRHTSVLRSLKKIGKAEVHKDEAFAGEQRVRLDSAWKRENTRVVVFVEERTSRKILAAGSSAVTP
ncbi:MAG TPA: DUF1223 domain-containing protein [Candidatus Acidoferrum sp.]|jgi:hypothetical protein|nr:DUF1223 domain-containing protein [Candidatus Acidoferrum sp.]